MMETAHTRRKTQPPLMRARTFQRMWQSTKRRQIKERRRRVEVTQHSGGIADGQWDVWRVDCTDDHEREEHRCLSREQHCFAGSHE